MINIKRELFYYATAWKGSEIGLGRRVYPGQLMIVGWSVRGKTYTVVNPGEGINKTIAGVHEGFPIA